MIKVTITKLVGQTGLLKVGTIKTINKKTAEHWIKNGWAKKVAVKKKKNVTKSDN